MFTYFEDFKSKQVKKVTRSKIENLAAKNLLSIIFINLEFVIR